MTATATKKGMPVPAELWDAEERAAWQLPRQITPSQWAVENRTLDRGESDLSGPWRNENAPYLVGIMDFFIRPGVVQANVMKAAQVGVSEALRNIIAFMADIEPDPIGLTLPDRPKGRKIVKTKVRPLFYKIPALRKNVGRAAHDAQLELIQLLNGFSLALMWSGSASSTSSDPLRMVVNDEVDKFEAWAGDEPDAVARTFKRLRSFGDRGRQINVSTPTTTTGQIYELYRDSTVKLEWQAPCPHCGEFQPLAFTQLKWDKFPAEAKDKNELAALVVQRQACWLECVKCGRRIEESQRPAMIRAGRWSTADGYALDAAGVKHADAADVLVWPAGTRLGFHLSAMACLWTPWADIASEFLRGEGKLGAAFNFKTETLGEPFESQVSRVSVNVFREKSARAALPEGTVPAWGWNLIATVDTQADHFYVVVRAWGAGMKSARVWHGKVLTFSALEALIFGNVWPLDPAVFPNSPPLKINYALIDSGGTADELAPVSRTMEVYQWVLPRQAVCRAIKGASRGGPGLYWPMRDPMESPRSTAMRRRIPEGLRAWMLDTHRCADLLDESVKRRDPESWLLNMRNDEEYNSHLSAMHRTIVRHGSQTVERWTPVHAGGRHDYWDAEVYQMAAAYMCSPIMFSEEQLFELRKRQIEEFHRNEKARQDGGRNTGKDDDRWAIKPI